MSEQVFDVLIIGSGVAGLAAAIKLAEKGLKIGIMTREEDPKISNTFWAQGGIIYSFEKFDLLVEDIMKASSGTAYEKAARILAEHSGPIFEELLIKKAKTEFCHDPQNHLMFTKEAAHSTARIVFMGDYTGKAIQTSLLNYLNDKNRFPEVHFLTGMTAIDLLTPNHHGIHISQRYEENRVVGAYAFEQKSGNVLKFLSKMTILATGGIGALYLHHSNSEGARGDGHAMAQRAGAGMMNMEFVQFHPTTFYDRSTHRRFLISEALRGEGGVLVNSRGKAFMKNYHPDGDLAPRDVVARAILKEMILERHDCVYLDISFKNRHWLKQRFPTIYNHCKEKGLDISESPIPVVPAAHYSCGGVKTNLKGETNVPALYAVGEVACTGLHGANRLASTSLLEGLTWGYFAAKDILEKIDSYSVYNGSSLKEWELAKGACELSLIQQDWLTLKQTMWNYVGLTRSKNRLLRAHAMISQLADEVQKFYRHSMLHDELIGLRNALEVADVVVRASTRNKQSVGCFYLEDQDRSEK